jgi:hypothetical protein
MTTGRHRGSESLGDLLRRNVRTLLGVSEAATDAAHEHSALRDVMNAYFAAIDTRRWDDLGLCFTPDADFGMGGSPPDGANAHWIHGREDIVRAVRSIERYRATIHSHANSTFSIRDDMASGTTQAIAILIDEPGEPGEPGGGAPQAFVRGLTYRDEFVRGAGAWQIRRHTHMPQWQFVANAVDPMLRPGPVQ